MRWPEIAGRMMRGPPARPSYAEVMCVGVGGPTCLRRRRLAALRLLFRRQLATVLPELRGSAREVQKKRLLARAACPSVRLHESSRRLAELRDSECRPKGGSRGARFLETFRRKVARLRLQAIRRRAWGLVLRAPFRKPGMASLIGCVCILSLAYDTYVFTCIHVCVHLSIYLSNYLYMYVHYINVYIIYYYSYILYTHNIYTYL